jgi:hypothetical protein
MTIATLSLAFVLLIEIHNAFIEKALNARQIDPIPDSLPVPPTVLHLDFPSSLDRHDDIWNAVFSGRQDRLIIRF